MIKADIINKNLGAILESRERRAAYQQKLIKDYKKTLISFKLNIPGPKKDSELYRKIFKNGQYLLEKSLMENNIAIRFKRSNFDITGPEAFIVADGDSKYIKSVCTEIEEQDMLGRIYDFDVIDSSGEIISRGTVGREQRKCFLCDEYVWVCSRSRAHSLEEMLQFIEKSAKAYFE
tara:strand:- start:293 stop:820 length:528 start_codon:yes stop_codon:yes gene_type:complete